MNKMIGGVLLGAALMTSIATEAQDERNKSLVKMEEQGWEYELKAGLNIGGTSPLPLPVEIRSIDSYSPRLNGTLEGTATWWIGRKRKWGVSAALKLETKGMSTGATVKNYSTQIIDEGEKVSGFWTGKVKTNYSAHFITLPLMANYQLSSRWKVRAGMWLSYLTEGDFSGHVSDGYLREGTPVGEKIEFKDGKRASYDFNDELNCFLWGLQAGGSWRAYSHFLLTADLTWGMNDVFKSSFKTITFDMYPIYLNVGFGYRF